MASLSVAVMAHHKREQFVGELIERLGIGENLVSWDRRSDRWDTGSRAFQIAAEAGAEWTGVIQDDALICRDFIAGLERALDHVPEKTIVSPFIGRGQPLRYVQQVAYAVEQARIIGASWLLTRALMWGVMIVVPTETVGELLERAKRMQWPAYDKRVGQFYLHEGWTTRYTWPSLIDHRDVPSLSGHWEGRSAHWFAGEAASALDFDWSGPVVEVHPDFIERGGSWSVSVSR